MSAKLKTILLRIVAVCAVEVFGIVGVGSVVGVEVWKSAAVAVLAAVATVLRGIGLAYLDDGKLDNAEIDAAFQKYAQEAKDE